MHKDGMLVTSLIKTHENWMDIMLLRAFIVEQPIDAPHGKQGTGCMENRALTHSTAQDTQGKLVDKSLHHVVSAAQVQCHNQSYELQLHLVELLHVGVCPAMPP